MSAPFKILHVASFYGNVGDAANHAGFMHHLGGAIANPSVTQLEIRRSYWGEWAFDGDFVDLANAHDLVVFGGGNFFELWVEKSRTGCTIDLPPELVAKIRTPIYFNGLGCDPYKGASEQSLDRFRRFLDCLLQSPRIRVTCRNDGSRRTLNEIVGRQYGAAVSEVPDGGFFVGDALGLHAPAPSSAPVLGISLAGDMPELRFGQPKRGWCSLTQKEFVEQVADAVTWLHARQPDMKFVFFPHIFRDLAAISAVLDILPDRIRRMHCRVAPYVSGPDSHKTIFAEYAACTAVVGMRFHSVVCSIGFGLAPIGLVTYPKILDTLEGIGLAELAYRYDLPDAPALGARLEAALSPTPDLLKRVADVNAKLKRDMAACISGISDWLRVGG